MQIGTELSPPPSWCSAILLGALVLLASCARLTSTTTVSASTAYSDGFEVAIFDRGPNGALVNVRSLLLADAEKAIANGASAVAPRDSSVIERALSRDKSGDSQASVTVTPMASGGERIRLAFHDSNRTFVYEYEVNGARLTPVASEYRDLSRRERVVYSPADAHSSMTRPMVSKYSVHFATTTRFHGSMQYQPFHGLDPKLIYRPATGPTTGPADDSILFPTDDESWR